VKGFEASDIIHLWDKQDDQVLAYQRKDLIFVYNFNPTNSYTDYGILLQKGAYKAVLNTDSKDFGGFGLTDDSIVHITQKSDVKDKEWLYLYLPARSAVVLRKQK
jgi:1,4-alpha-glucan branching enzyme